MKQYNKDNIPLAKALRKGATKQEKRLWYEYLSKYPIKFQRQKAIGNYIADFYCAKARLVIELDGRGHNLQAQLEKDVERTRYLESVDLKVLRFRNSDVDNNLRGVCGFIDQAVKERLQNSDIKASPIASL